MPIYIEPKTPRISRTPSAKQQSRPQVRLSGLRGLSGTGNVVAEQIVRTAELWLSFAESYQGGNSDRNNLTPLVKRINSCAGLDANAVDASGSGASYCLSWTWLVVKGAIECLGGQNCLPLESGSTWKMLRTAKGSSVRVDTVPAVGSVFFRGRMYYSGSNAGLSRNIGGSGHCGIVTKVYPDGGFECIDANGRKSELNGTAINRDTYTRAEIDKYNRSDTATSPQFPGITGKFQFVHVEDCPVKETAPLDVLRIMDNCMPECKRRPSPPIVTTPPGNNTPPETRPPDRTPPPVRVPPPGVTTPPEPPARCETLIVVPCSKALTIVGEVPHFSVFKTLNWEIKNQWFSRLSDEESLTIAPSDPYSILTRFPMVKDKFGKRIIISCDDPETYGGGNFQRMNSMELWGKDVVFYHIPRRWKGGFANLEDQGWVGGGWAQRAASQLLTPVNEGGKEGIYDAMAGWFTWDGKNQNEVNGKRVNSASIRRQWNSFKPEKANIWSILEKIERLGAPSGSVPATYVIVLEGSVGTFFQENVEVIVTVATAAAVVAALAVTIFSGGTLSAAGVAGVIATATAVRAALSPIIVKAANQQEITLADIAAAANGLADVVEKNSSDPKLKQIAQDVKMYSNKAVQVMGAVAQKDWMKVAKELTPLAERAFPQITNIIGEDGKKLEGEFLLLNNAYADIKNAIGGEVKDIAGTVQQYSKNMNLSNALKAVASGAQGEELLSALGSGADIMQSPTLRNLFLSESTGNAAGMLPGISQILAGVMQSDTHSRANIPDAETFADFGAMALGTQTTSNTLDSLQLRGLFERAEQFARNNLNFAIPSALSPERQECYAREIMQCTGIGGANCAPPKYFHAGTNTCKDPCADDEERNTETGDCVKKKYAYDYPGEWESVEQFGQPDGQFERREFQREQFERSNVGQPSDKRREYREWFVRRREFI